MSSSSTRTVVTVAAVTVLTGLVAYAVYFDHKRRNNVDFRKQLRKDQKRAKKARDQVAASSAAEAAASMGPLSDDDIRAALALLKAEKLPTSVQDREAYFSENISRGEVLSQAGPGSYLEAALAFYRGIRVYPAPLELIMIYQKMLPEPIFNILMKLTTFEAKDKAEAYYDQFPPKSMKVQVKQVPADDKKTLKNVLVAAQDFAVGDIIYQELPMASALDTDLEGDGTHCSQCMRRLSGVTPVLVEDDPLSVAYCSSDCRDFAREQHHSMLMSLTPFLAIDTTPVPPGPRRAAQSAFVEQLKKSGLSRPLVALRLFASQVINDARTVMQPNLKMNSRIPEADPGSEYSFIDHLERLRFLEVHADDQEIKTARAVVATSLGGEVGDVLADEQYNTLKGKVAYNNIGIVYNGGRDKSKSDAKKDGEAFEWSRTPLGTQRQVGSGIYRVSSYLTHSCTPSVRPTFPNGNYELHLVASRSIAKGEQLTMAYVEVARAANETAVECCMRRRKQLAIGWSFVCLCERCLEERPKPATVPASPITNPADATPDSKASEDDAKDEEESRSDAGSEPVVVESTVKAEDAVRKFEEDGFESVPTSAN